MIDQRRTGFRTRLAVAFVGVALATVSVAAAVVGISTTRYIAALEQQQQAVVASAMATAAGAAWKDQRQWTQPDLISIFGLAAQIGVELRVSDATGRPVRTSDGFVALRAGPRSEVPIVVAGRAVGSVMVRFQGSGFTRPGAALRTELWRTLAIASTLACLIALVVALIISELITSPLAHLIKVVQSGMAADSKARVGPIRGPSELRKLGVIYDQMADRREGQERAHRNLVADLAHELRTPVAVLQAGHEAMLDGAVQATPEQLSGLRDQVLRLAHMVDELQRLASAESAAIQLTLVTCDLAEIARGAADSLAEMFVTVGIKLTTRLVSVPVRADALRLHDVVINLLTNALKYTQPGGEVVLKTGPEGEWAVLRVSDNGPGIAPDELPHIFDRFFRGRHAAAAAGGSGIGLTIAAALVKAHQGRLDVTSDVGKGTRFVVSLPVSRMPVATP